MTIKDIQVYVDNDYACRKRIEMAVKLTEIFNANLTGIHVRRHHSNPDYNVPVSEELRLIYDDILNDNESEAHSLFTKITDANDVAVSWRSPSGSLNSSIADEALYCDLLVLGQPNPKDPLSIDEENTGEVLMSSGYPCLLVPYNYESSATRFNESPLIAWDGSREASRAVHNALPLLKKAGDATVLILESEKLDMTHSDSIEEMIAEHLGRHGINIKVDIPQGSLQSPGETLLNYADAHNHDLIVMGAYGYARWHKIVLGSATQTILENTKVPVFMSH